MSKRTKFTIGTLTEDVGELSRDVWLAGLGALSLAEEEGTKLYKNLVESGRKLENQSRKQIKDLENEARKTFGDFVKRGEKAEQRGRKQLTDQVEAVRGDIEERRREVTGTVSKVTDKVEETIAGSVEKALERLEVPTRTEVRDLAKKVDMLAERVNRLAGVLEKAKAPKPAPAAEEAETTVYHVVPRDEGWAIEKEGAERATSLLPTKSEALEAARELSKEHEPSRLVVHRKDGTIQDQFTYGTE